MSRVDEALRQASVATVPVESGTMPPTTPGVPPTGPAKLEHYPQELSRSSEDASRSEPSRGDVAAETRRKRRWRVSAGWAERLVTSSRIPDITVEQYRRLAATIHDLQVRHGLNTLMVTSALPQEGKTLTATNLALTLSESYGRRVLLIDADLRQPTLQQVFRLPAGGGLNEALRSENDVLPAMAVTSRLSVLVSGGNGVNPMAALTSDRMRLVLERAAARFDWVLLDTPPVAVLPDGQLLAHLIRAVIFVIQAASTPLPVVEKAIAELGRECIVGAVLNNADEYAVPATSYYRKYGMDQDSA